MGFRRPTIIYGQYYYGQEAIIRNFQQTDNNIHIRSSREFIALPTRGVHNSPNQAFNPSINHGTSGCNHSVDPSQTNDVANFGHNGFGFVDPPQTNSSGYHSSQPMYGGNGSGHNNHYNRNTPHFGSDFVDPTQINSSGYQFQQPMYGMYGGNGSIHNNHHNRNTPHYGSNFVYPPPQINSSAYHFQQPMHGMCGGNGNVHNNHLFSIKSLQADLWDIQRSETEFQESYPQ